MTRIYGGNSGYNGYSISKRGQKAKDGGRFPKTAFKKEYNLSQTSFDMLCFLGIIRNGGEWHHTSKFGNRTTFFSWVDDFNDNYFIHYQQNKKEIDKILKDGENLLENPFDKKIIFWNRLFFLTKDLKQIKQNERYSKNPKFVALVEKAQTEAYQQQVEEIKIKRDEWYKNSKTLTEIKEVVFKQITNYFPNLEKYFEED